MNNRDKNTERRALVGTLGAAAIAGVAMGTSSCAATRQVSGFQPGRHDQDAWMDQIPGIHRVFIDTDNAAGGTNALRYGLNILNAHVNGYGGTEDEMAMIICYRHMSTPYAFNDAMWEKYGSVFASLAGLEGDVPTVNTLKDSLEGMAGRGVHYAVCSAATRLISTFISRQNGGTVDEAFAELTSNTIPNAHMVPAGVMAIMRAQEYGYSFMYSAA